MPVEQHFSSPITELFNIKHPIMLAGMNVAAGPRLAAAVTNAGGLGVIGGVNYTPNQLRKTIKTLKDNLVDKKSPFGVDLLLPQVGGSARKTNYDYTKGTLPALIDIIIEEGAALFVSAVGVPPRYAVDKLHAAGIPIMNMVGAPKHVIKALDAGADIICAQGGEGGGHTGDVATSILLPACVDLCKNRLSPLTGKRVPVVAAGGISDGRGLAMSLCMGADAVWVGTRFVASKEAGAPPRHKKAICSAGYDSTVRSLIYTGRPLRVIRSGFIDEWQMNDKQILVRELLDKGVLPITHLQSEATRTGEEVSFEKQMEIMPMLSGAVAARINSVLSAQEIVDEMVLGAVASLKHATGTLKSKL